MLALSDASGVGASATASGAIGAPSVSLTAKAKGSLSLAVGNDYDNAISRTVGGDQQLISQWVDAGAGDTYWVQATDRSSRRPGQRIRLNDTAPTSDQWNLAAVEVKPRHLAASSPVASIINPVPSQTVSGTVPVAAVASDNIRVRSVQFILDGRKLGGPILAPPYAIKWRTASVHTGTHRLWARVLGASGLVGLSRRVEVRVANPAPRMTCFVMQSVSADGRSAVTTPAFHTAAPRETLLALVSSGGPATRFGQRVIVSGGSLRWTLVRRANRQSGDAEIWQAQTRGVMAAVRVTARQARSGYRQELTVVAMQGTDGVGASASRSAAGGRSVVKLKTSSPVSLIFGVGFSAGAAQARTLPTGWVLLREWLATSSFWSQYTNVPVQAAGRTVLVSDGAPGERPWDLAAVEITGDGG